MGVAELIPGVSGANFALVMGIYDDYILVLDQIANFIGKIVQFVIRKCSFTELKVEFRKVKWGFGLSIILGTFFASAIFSNLIVFLLDEKPNYVFALFFGLVLASAAIPWKEIKIKLPKHYVIMLVTAILFFIILGLKPTSLGKEPPEWLIFAGGVIGVVGNVLPGISGPFLLLLFGLYEFIIDLLGSVTTLTFTVHQLYKFAFFFAGQLVGLAIFIKLIKWLLNKYTGELMAFMTGIMLASLRLLYPYFEGSTTENTLKFPWEVSFATTLAYTILAILGILVVLLLNRFADRRQIEKLD